MAVVERQARTLWTGDVQKGQGKVTGATGAFSDMEVSLPTRSGEAKGNSSPEEFLAAAHSSCLAMNISATLTQNGTPPEELDVNSTVGFGAKDGGGYEVKHSHVTIRGKVPGLTAEEFTKLAEQGEQTCPVSNALRGNIEITTEISFEG